MGIGEKRRIGLHLIVLAAAVTVGSGFVPVQVGTGSGQAAPVSGSQGLKLVGIGRPNPKLATKEFVKVDRNDPRDKPNSKLTKRLQTELESWLGVPYVWGGTTKTGVDTSGFVKAGFKAIGINLPRHSQDMGRVPIGIWVTGALHYGDVLVFPSPKHVAIYIGDGNVIEAVRGGVQKRPLGKRDHACVRRFF